MAEPIEGKVAKILDEYSIVINVGRAQGVTTGMPFVIFAEGDDVADPDTGESIGKWELVKGRVSAVHVQERLTICQAQATAGEGEQSDPSTHTLSAAMIADHMRAGERARDGAEKLDVNVSEVAGVPQAGPISVGDLVRSVV